MTAPAPQPLIWLDLEMTGLHPEHDRILEIASVVTDSDLNVEAEGPSLVIHQSGAALAGMDEWNTSHHGRSGLTNAVRRSRIGVADAEAQTLDFLRRHTLADASPLCGNSVWQDRRFLARYMPALHAHLHYRLIDVSTLSELVARWRPGLMATRPAKRSAHRALDDVYESIAELAWYRSQLFPEAGPASD